MAAWCWLGRVPFDRTVALQEALRERILRGEAQDTLLLCEHEPVITLGRHARGEHVLMPAAELERQGIAVRPASRGGDVTYHGPGQLVGYPVYRLRRGLLAHMEAMAGAVIDVLAGLGLRAEWRRDCPGVWIDERKICAFGVHIRRRVAIHGFALNVTTDPAAFRAIVPCGLRAAGVTSLAELGVRPPPLPAIAFAMASAIAKRAPASIQ
jgi:lipoate-protein ligase B